MSSGPVYRMCAQVAPSGECLRGYIIIIIIRTKVGVTRVGQLMVSPYFFLKK